MIDLFMICICMACLFVVVSIVLAALGIFICFILDLIFDPFIIYDRYGRR